MNLFMIDIESTGVDKDNDDIIEIGIVRMYKRPDGFYEPSDGKDFHTFVFTDKKPTSKFALEHMTEVYASANKTQPEKPENLNRRIVEWLKSYGSKGAENTQFCGWNASTFDLPFMVKKGFLTPSGYDKDDNLIGDFHYRPYEISGAIELAADALGYSRKTILRMAEETRKKHTVQMPEGKDHDAIYDCYKQINLLNGLIAITKK